MGICLSLKEKKCDSDDHDVMIPWSQYNNVLYITYIKYWAYSVIRIIFVGNQFNDWEKKYYKNQLVKTRLLESVDIKNINDAPHLVPM